MGRQAKSGGSVIDHNKRVMECSCGELVTVFNSDVKEVTCSYCAMGVVPVRTDAQFEELDRVERERALDQKQEMIEKKKRGRGRPKGSKNKSSGKISKYERKPNNEYVNTKQNLNHNTSEKKNTISEKGKPMNEKKSTGRRGRKSTVGVAILNLLNNEENGSGVHFNKILETYKETNKSLGKNLTDPIMERNCRSSLYIMKRDGKIREVEHRNIYAINKNN